RKKWNIRPEEKVVMMQMGRQGMGGRLVHLLQTMLLSQEKIPPLYLAILIGNNHTMKEEMEALTAKLSPHSPIRVEVFGALNEEQMNELYNMSSVMIGKAGGSTTAEIIHMGVFGLVFPSWKLEQCNVDKLVNM